MRTAPYVGERARYAVAYLNEEFPEERSGKPGPMPDGEGWWLVTPAATQWDSAMGGRTLLRWDDQTIIGQAEALYGAEAFDRWIDETKRNRLA